MKVFAIFAFIQIVGILGNPSTLELDQPQNDGIEKVQALRRFFSRIKVLHLNEYPAEWTRLGRRKCRMNGGINAENSGVQGMETYLDSLIELTNHTQYHLETAYHASYGSLASAIETACNWLTRTNTLTKNFIHSLTPCWSTKESTSANLIHNISSALVQYACENEGSRLSTFLTTDGDICLPSSRYEIQPCFDPSSSSDTEISEDAHFFRPMSSPCAVPIINVNTQACGELGTLQQCIVRVLGRCPNPTPSHEINSLFNIVKNTSGCESLSNEELFIFNTFV